MANYTDVKDEDEIIDGTTDTSGSTSTDTSNSTPTISTNENYLNYLGANADATAYNQQINKLTNEYAKSRQNMIAQSNLNQIAQNESLAAQGLAKAYNQNPNSGYSESSRIALDVALQNNLAQLGQEQRDTVNELSLAMAKSQQYADAYLNAFNLDKQMNGISNKLSLQQTLTPEEIGTYKDQTGTDIYAYLYDTDKTLLQKQILSNSNSGTFGTLSNGQVIDTISEMSYEDILNNSENIQTILNNIDSTKLTSNEQTKYNIMKALSGNDFNAIQKNILNYIVSNDLTADGNELNLVNALASYNLEDEEMYAIADVLGLTEDEVKEDVDVARQYYQNKYDNGTITTSEIAYAKLLGIEGSRYSVKGLGSSLVNTDDIDVTIFGKSYDLVSGNIVSSNKVTNVLNSLATGNTDTTPEIGTIVVNDGKMYIYKESRKGNNWHQVDSDSDDISSAIDRWNSKYGERD